jgi:flagellar protein FliS
MLNTGSNQALNAYAKVNIEAAINTASPVQLIVLLYDGAINAIASAKGALSQSKIEEKGRLLSRAIGIIECLRTVLDKEKGGKIAQDLNDLYDYMKRQLLLGNLKNQTEYLDEVIKLLSEIRGAWVILATPKNTAPAMAQDKPATKSGTSYGKA